MLAALAVLAVAGLALMNAMTTGVRAASLAQESALAGLAADNILALQIAGEGGQSLRSRTGRYELAGSAYDWRLSVEAAPGGDLDQVTLVLERDDREAARRVTFVRRAS
jgi:general secretion pathway protein I